jgi:hypothetical protein
VGANQARARVCPSLLGPVGLVLGFYRVCTGSVPGRRPFRLQRRAGGNQARHERVTAASSTPPSRVHAVMPMLHGFIVDWGPQAALSAW